MKRRTRRDQANILIERAYYKHAEGKMISILDIPKLYRDVEAMLANGHDLDTAMIAAVAVYCQPAR